MFALKTYIMLERYVHSKITADDAMSDVNFQNNNVFNIFLLITKTTEFGQVEGSCHHVRSSFNRERKAMLMSFQCD